MSSHPANLPEPPYYAVIFSSRRNGLDAEGYKAMSDEMEALGAEMPGFLGIESVRDADGNGITVSYWRDLESIREWGRHPAHLEAQRIGREQWYDTYEVRTARVERASGLG